MTYSEQGQMFKRQIQEEATGKTITSLAHSRNRRDEILRMFHGELPMSIMKAQKVARKHDPAAGSYRASSKVEAGNKLSEIFDVSGQSVRSGALSMFPQNIGRAVLLLYSKPDDIVVDPFAGHNSRMELCATEGRRYIGYDVSIDFMAFNRTRAQELDGDIELYLCDSRLMKHTPDNVGDFTLTSPPYWDLEDYGDETEQLGLAKTYEGFLKGLATVARQNYRCLRPGAFCVWFINDFRRKGQFYVYHRDVLALLERAGFVIWDIMIVDLGYPIRAAFATQITDQQILPKRHEYGLVMRKPI